MDRYSNGLLIGFGFALGGLVGFTIGVIAAPYWLEIKTLETGAKAPALIEGYGDVWGGLLSAIVAFVAAYFVWWIQHRKEEQERAEERAYLADKVAIPVEALLSNIEMVTELVEIDPERKDFFNYCHGMQGVWTRLVEIMGSTPPDKILGMKINRRYQAALRRAESFEQSIRLRPNEVRAGSGVDKQIFMLAIMVRTILRVLTQDLREIAPHDQIVPPQGRDGGRDIQL